jgi:hypothetical protein
VLLDVVEVSVVELLVLLDSVELLVMLYDVELSVVELSV